MRFEIVRSLAAARGFHLTIAVIVVAGAPAWAPAFGQPCMSNPDCDDGQVCNGVETCDLMANFCRSGSPVVCNDGNPCTVDFCTEPSGTCQSNTTPDAETARGPDGLCNTSDDNLALFGTDGSCGTMDDTTGDGVCALVDNCGDRHNPGQEDADRDGIGDACDPTPCLVRGLYALSGGALYRVDPNSGTATFVVAGFNSPTDVAVDAADTTAYVTSLTANSLWVVDLTTRSILNATSLNGPWGVDVGGSQLAYVAERTGATLTRVGSQGNPLPPVAFGLDQPTGVDVNAAETTAYVATSGMTPGLYAVNLGNGSATLVAGGLSGPVAVALNPAETDVYVIEQGANRLSRVNVGTGTVTTITSSLFQPGGLALDAAGTIGYVTDRSTGFTAISAVNLTTGAVTPVTGSGPGQIPFEDGLALSPRPPVVLSLPDDASGVPAASVPVPVNLDDVTGLGVLSVDVRVRYNRDVLMATSVGAGSLTGSCTLTSNVSNPGEVVISVFCTSALSGSGSVAVVNFSVGGARGQGSPLDITFALLNEGTPPVCPDDGRFVVPVEIAGRILYYRDHTAGTEPSAKPVDGATVDLEAFQDDGMGMIVPVPAGSTASDCNGIYMFTGVTPVLEYETTPRKAGDSASAIDPFDASLNAQHVVGLITLTGNQRLAADATGNGFLTSFDSARIAQFSVGLIAQLPVAVVNGSDWSFVPSAQAEPNQQVSNPFPAGNQQGRIRYSPIVESAENQDFLAILYGDVSGNWVGVCPAPGGGGSGGIDAAAAGGAGALLEAASATAGRLVLPDLRAKPGDLLAVPVRAEGLSGAVSFYLDLRFDPSVLRLVRVDLGAGASGFSLTPNLTEAGRARLALFHTRPLAGDGDLVVATFEVIGRVGSRTTLALPAFTVNEGRIAAAAEEGSVRVLPPRAVR